MVLRVKRYGHNDCAFAIAKYALTEGLKKFFKDAGKDRKEAARKNKNKFSLKFPIPCFDCNTGSDRLLVLAMAASFGKHFSVGRNLLCSLMCLFRSCSVPKGKNVNLCVFFFQNAGGVGISGFFSGLQPLVSFYPLLHVFCVSKNEIKSVKKRHKNDT